MKRRNNNSSDYLNKRRLPHTSYGHRRLPAPSVSRRSPTPSRNNSRPPPHLYRKPISTPSYPRVHSPTPSYKNYKSRKKPNNFYKNRSLGSNRTKKIGIGAFCLIATGFLVYGGFAAFNHIPIENADNGGGSSGGNFNEKIAAFFWASDKNLFLGQVIIDRYIDILTNEGFTKFFQYKDTSNFNADFQLVADYEKSNDIVFFYLIGHGFNDGQHSYTHFRPGGSRVASNVFRTKCDALDSSRIGLLIESCESGDWSDDMIGGGYLAMSTCDENHNAYPEPPAPSEGLFTGAFFDAVQSGSNAIDAFSAARSVASSQYPKLCDESAHDFFGD